jgi:hypothetical protein
MKDPEMIFVRPDGYIGMRVNGLDAEALQRYLASSTGCERLRRCVSELFSASDEHGTVDGKRRCSSLTVSRRSGPGWSIKVPVRGVSTTTLPRASTRRTVPATFHSFTTTRLRVAAVAMPHAAAALPHPTSFGAAAARTRPLPGIALLTRAAVQAHRAVRVAATGVRASTLLAAAAHVHRPTIVLAMHSGVMMRRTRGGEERKRGYQNPYTCHAHDFVLLEIPGYAAARRRQVGAGGRNRRIGRYS